MPTRNAEHDFKRLNVVLIDLQRRKAMNTAAGTERMDHRSDQKMERLHADDLQAGRISDQEMERLHADDLQAGRVVVGIMTGVFLVGLLLYSFICWIAMS
jgi:hypothetical protein